MDEIGMRILTTLPRALPQLVILAFCIYYLTKRVTADGILLFSGSLIGNLATIFYMAIMPYLNTASIPSVSGKLQLYTIIGVINLIGSLAFTVGFIILIIKTIKQTNNLSASNANKQSKDLLMDDSV